MHSRLLVSSLPRSLPPLPPSPDPPCLPCVEERQRAAPHSSFPPRTTPLQTLRMDVWGPARVSGHGRERYFLLVVDDYTRYTTVFPLCSKGEVVDVLIPLIRTVRLQLRKRFSEDLPVLRLHPDRGGEFSSDLLREFCRGEGILQSFTLPDSPHQNGIAERRIGLVMEVARTSMIHAGAPHFLCPFAVQYAAHQLNLWPCGSRAFVCDTSTDKLSARAIPCVFPGFLLDAPSWHFYHPTSRCVLPSHDVTFDKSVPFYRLFPYCSAPPLPPPLFLAPGPPPVDPLPPQGPAPSGVSQVDPLPGTAPVQVAVGSGAAPGAASGGAASEGAASRGATSGGVASGGAEPGGAGSEGVGSGGVEPRGAGLEGAESGGAEPQGAALFGGHAGASPRLSSQQLREWLVRRAHRRSGAPGAREAGDTGARGAAGTTGAGGTGGTAGTGPGGARTSGAGDTVRPRSYFVPLLQQPAFRPVLPIRTARRAPRSRPPPVLGMHTMALRPSSIPLRVPLPAPPESSLPEVPDPASDRARAASPTISRLLANAVTDPSFESAAASALVAELLDFAAACHLDYASALVAESVPTSPPSVGGECALGTDILEDRQEDFECLAVAVPRFASMVLAPQGDPDAPHIPTLRSCAEEITVPPSRANIVDGMWIFRVKRPPGSPPAFKARYIARGFNQRQGVYYFHTFSPNPKMTTLWVLLHVAAQRDYEFHSLDFSTPFLQGSLHEEIWLRRPPGFTGTFPAGTQWSLRRPVYGLRQAPREWHDTLTTTLAALGFAPSRCFYAPTPRCRRSTSSCTRDTPALTWVLQRFGFKFSSPQPTPLSTSHSLSVAPSNESVEPSGPYPELVGCLISSCEAEIYAGAMATQELCWLTYLLTDLAEQPRSPPVLYVDNKAMIALFQEHRLEHRTKHIALRYFLARELQQRGQLCLAYVAARANTADVFTKALPPGDHERFATVLGLVPTLPHLLTA
ncbi:unnamed protein product [Closterium sp. NIES-53]